MNLYPVTSIQLVFLNCIAHISEKKIVYTIRVIIFFKMFSLLYFDVILAISLAITFKILL